MYIAGINYHLGRNALEIYFAGCYSPHCPGCHNPELQSFIQEDNIEEYKKIIKIKIETGMVDEVSLMGGEPLDQNLKELENLIRFIKKLNVDIWMWTKYDDYYDRCNFLYLIDYVKYGKYEKNLPSYVNKEYEIELASSNQKIIKIIV